MPADVALMFADVVDIPAVVAELPAIAFARFAFAWARARRNSASSIITSVSPLLEKPAP